MSHFDLVCPVCDKRVGGCRCIGQPREKRKDTKACPSCAKVAAHAKNYGAVLDIVRYCKVCGRQPDHECHNMLMPTPDEPPPHVPFHEFEPDIPYDWDGKFQRGPNREVSAGYEKPSWACFHWGGYEHDWMDCPECLAAYDVWNEERE